MHPVLFEIGSIAIRSYDFFVVGGMAAGLVLVGRRARAAGLSAWRVVLGGIGVVLIGLAGARLGKVIVNWRYYLAHWREIFSLMGHSYQPGLLAGTVAGLVLARRLRVSGWAFADLWAPGIALAQAIGRIGCLLNTCCHGVPTHSFLAMYLPDHLGEWEWRYPTQLMHSAADLAIMGVLLAVDRRKPFAGFLFLLYLILYSAQRAAIDFVREDTSYLFGARAAQVIGVATIVAAGAVLAIRWRRSRRAAHAE